MTDSPFTKLIEFLPSRHTYTETEVRLVMAGMQAEIDRAEAERDVFDGWDAAHAIRELAKKAAIGEGVANG